MAKRKAGANGAVKGGADKDASSSAATASASEIKPIDVTADSTSRVDILAASAAITEREPVKVNNMNAVDLKNACDDAVKKVCLHLELCISFLFDLVIDLSVPLCGVVALATEFVQRKTYSYGCEAAPRVGERVHCCWDGDVWMESRL